MPDWPPLTPRYIPVPQGILRVLISYRIHYLLYHRTRNVHVTFKYDMLPDRIVMIIFSG